MTKKIKTLVLLDAHAIIHRAYHALPDFLSSRGEPTGALYGLSSMLMKIISELKPDYIAACYDLPGKTFRHEAYQEYKAGRAKAEAALVEQLKSSREIFEAFNIPIYDSPGFEADDILGTIAAKLKEEEDSGKLRIIVGSGDMDTMQLVRGEKVQVYTLKKGLNDTILYDQKKVEERFGFSPEFLPDYKSLRGDPSDNIIGVKGIGEKTATELIREFGTIERIYEKLKQKGGEEHLKELGLSERLIKLLREGEEEALFSKTLAKIRTDCPIKFSLPEKTFWQTADPKKIEGIFEKFEFRSLLSRLKNFFGRNDTKETTANSEKINSLELKETSIALWLLNSSVSNPNMDDILRFAKTESFPEAREYIFKKLKEENLQKVYEEIERPIIPAVEEMQKRGILIDKEYFKKLSREYHKDLDKLTADIYKETGGEFNLNSPKQLSEILFDRLGLKSRKKSSGGAKSTSLSVLEELEEEHPIIKKIIEYRELAKLLSGYIDAIPKMTGADGRLRAEFIQNGTSTGRFSSQNPNLQNLPIRSELGKRIRRGFISQKGFKLAAFDYSQIELRVAAILSGDGKLTEIFKKNEDVHAGVASYVFGKPPEEITPEMRRQAKVINFGILYGMGIAALRRNLGGTREEAQKFYDNYFSQFKELNGYLEEVKKFATERGYTLTLFGRRRLFPDIRSRIPYLRALALRTAVNAPIQGTAADIIKLAIRYVREDLEKKDLLSKTHLVLQVHDELIYEIEEKYLSESEKIITDAMQSVLGRSFLHYKTDIPLLVRSGSGENIRELK